MRLVRACFFLFRGRIAMRSFVRLLPIFSLSFALPAFATVFATVHGVVHDPQHRPIVGAAVTLHASGSAFILHANTDARGEFEIAQAPIGVYTLEVSAPGFANASQTFAVASGTNPVLHIPLSLAQTTQSVTVEAEANSVSATDSVTPTTLSHIEQTPGRQPHHRAWR
jgi:hypothetical protein